MDTEYTDNIWTTAAVGLLAYASADIAHHVLGHGGACLALGGSIISMTSVFVNCSLHGATIDLAGPLTNLVIGVLAVIFTRLATRASLSTLRLFLTFLAGFNLFWFAGQLVFSVATRTDDWAWAMKQFHVGASVRFGLIAFGAFVYLWAMHVITSDLAPYARPRARAGRIVFIVWTAAGITACATAALDHNVITAIFWHALPQSVVMSIGLLLVPKRATQWTPLGELAPMLSFSIPWTIAAAIVGVTTVLLLGPGVVITR